MNNRKLEFAYRYRGVLMAPPFLFVLLVFKSEFENDIVIWPIGLALFFAGVSIRVWAQVHLHYRLRTRKVLTGTGPYVFVRNPIYIANTLMLVASAVMAELIWFVPLMLAWCALVYSAVVRREEFHLAEKYGQPYLDYMESVPRWIPLVQQGSRKSSSVKWRQFVLPSVVAELHCLLLLIPLIGKEFVSPIFH